MPVPSRQLIFVLLALTAAACGDVQRIDVSPTPPTTMQAVEPMQLARSSALDMAEVQRVVANVKKVTDVQLVHDTQQWNEAARAKVVQELGKNGAGVSSRPPVATTSSGDYHSWPDWPLWRAVGLCEQRGSGQYDTHGDGIAWGGSPAGGFPGSAYPGGLGMSVDFWREFAPTAGVTVSNGAYATPEEQIFVARVGSQNGTHMRGWSSWTNGCVARNGG